MKPILTAAFAFLVLLAAPSASDAQAGDEASRDLSNAGFLLAQGRGHDNEDVRLILYERVEASARAALEFDPEDHEARWWLIAALGLKVDEVGAREKVRAAREVHAEAERLLEVDDRHPGAHHAMGRLNAGIMRLNRVVRFVAVRIVGEDTLQDASWEAAETHLRIAIEEEPNVLVHRLELARAFETQRRTEEMIELLRHIIEADDSDPMDPVALYRARNILDDHS